VFALTCVVLTGGWCEMGKWPMFVQLHRRTTWQVSIRGDGLLDITLNTCGNSYGTRLEMAGPSTYAISGVMHD